MNDTALQVHKGVEMLPKDIELDGVIETFRNNASELVATVENRVDEVTAEFGTGDSAKKANVAEAQRLLNAGFDALCAAVRGNR